MNKAGFTLIELLVAVGVLLLLVGLGLANYISFNDRQALIQGAEQVREAVADAQNSARSGKLRGCDELASYQVSFSVTTVNIQSQCALGNADAARVFTLPSGVTVSGNTLYISPLNGFVFNTPNFNDSAAPYTVSLQNNYGTVDISVTRNGAVTLDDIDKK